MTRTPEQRLSDADKRKWYAPIPAEQLALGAKVNKDAARQALEDVSPRSTQNTSSTSTAGRKAA